MLLKICDSEEIIDIKRIDKKVNISSESCLRCKPLVCSKLGRMCELRNWSKTYGLNLIGKLFCPFLKAVCKQVKDLLYININIEMFIYQIAISYTYMFNFNFYYHQKKTEVEFKNYNNIKNKILVKYSL